MEKIKLKLSGLGCASCASKIETRSQHIQGVEKVIVDFSQEKLIAYASHNNLELITKQIINIIKEIEPHVVVEHQTENDIHQTPFVHNKRALLKLGMAIALLITGILLKNQPPLFFFLLMLAYLVSGYKVLLRSFQNITKGQIFDENFLMSVATLGAIAIGEYPEAVAVMIFYEIGEYFQNMAVAKSKKAIGALMDIRPDFATVYRDEQWIKVTPTDVLSGEKLLVKPGERVPLDGVIKKGDALVDTSALTGESVPLNLSVKDNILSGSVILDKLIEVEVTRIYSQSTVARILDLVENATANKAPTENFISKFARYYTPIVVGIAILISTLPPFILQMDDFNTWLYRGLVFLVISCPCALVVSVPLGFFSGIGNASKNGILVKGSNYLEALSSLDSIVFDKTGTLTEGVFEVVSIKRAKPSTPSEDILKYAALAEVHSSHPIAKSIVAHYGKPIDSDEIIEHTEITGYGVEIATVHGRILVGNAKLMAERNIIIEELEGTYTAVYVVHDGQFLGAIDVRDKIKEDASVTINELKKRGLDVVMLTGDRSASANLVSDALKIERVYSELLPADKYALVQEMIHSGKRVAFVGDGMNDAPVLAGATVGISMGGIGSDSAIEASDVVLMTDEPSKIIKAINVSAKTKTIVSQNIALALGIKFLVMGLGIFGLTSMWMAIFADVGVTLIAVVNAMRALR